MTWIFTVLLLISLGIFVAVMLGFFLYSRREEIREALRKPWQPRKEIRTQVRIGLELSSQGEPPAIDLTFTENISPHGARVVTRRRWRPNERVVVRMVQRERHTRARIAYCKPLIQGDAYAVGLELSSFIRQLDVVEI